MLLHGTQENSGEGGHARKYASWLERDAGNVQYQEVEAAALLPFTQITAPLLMEGGFAYTLASLFFFTVLCYLEPHSPPRTQGSVSWLHLPGCWCQATFIVYVFIYSLTFSLRFKVGFKIYILKNNEIIQ